MQSILTKRKQTENNHNNKALGTCGTMRRTQHLGTFPSMAVAKTPRFHHVGGRFSLWWEKKIAYATQPKNKQYSKVLEKWPNICIILSSKRRGGSRAERVFREICDSSRVRYHDGGVSRGQTTDRDKRGENPQTDPHRHAPLFCDGSKSAKDN